MNKLALSALLGATVCCALAIAKNEQPATGSNDQLVTETTTKDFKKDVLTGTEPVLVDFYATWCGPCRRQGPIIDKVASTYKGKLKVYRVDVDKNQELASALQISSIPVLAVFKDGHIVSASEGLTSEPDVVQLVNKAVVH